MPARFVTIAFSHFCEKARWALDHAGVAYEEEAHLPGAHAYFVKRAGGRRSVPILVTDRGVLTDSTAILRHADAHAPAGRALYPRDETARADADALEERFDTALGPATRRLVYFHVLGDRRTALRLLSSGAPLVERLALRPLFPFLVPKMRRFMRIDAAGAEASQNDLRQILADVGARLADGRRYLVGDSFGAADLTFAALVAPLVAPEGYGVTPIPGPDELPAALGAIVRDVRATPAGQFALRIYRDHRRPS